MYVDLGSENGGFPINISEEGMAFQGILPLELNQEISIAFKLYGIEEQLTATAKIVWLTDTRKGGGLQFIDLPEASRQTIRKWIALQGQAVSSNESATPAKPHFKPMGLPIPPVIPLPTASATGLQADLEISPIQTATIVAKEPPSSPQPAAKAAPAVTPNAPPKTQPETKKSAPKQNSRGAAETKRSPQIPGVLARGKKKQAWFRSYWFTVGLSVSIVMVVSGVMLWPLHRVLLAQFVRARQAQTDVQTSSAPMAVLPPAQPTVAEPSIDSTTIESPQSVPVADEPDNLTMPPAPTVALSTPIRLVQKLTPLAPQMNHRTASNAKVPAVPAVDSHPSSPAIVPAQNELPAAAPSSPISEDANKPAAIGTAAGKTPSLPAKPQENPASATGSTEIISDPYPSIRVPAESKERLSRPGTSLQMGRLISKVEPVYPQEALRQRIAGTVKVHVIIGQDGTVEKAELVNGPSLLAESVLRSVQQWRQEPTVLGGEPIEVEEDITVVFRITSPPPPAD